MKDKTFGGKGYPFVITLICIHALLFCFCFVLFLFFYIDRAEKVLRVTDTKLKGKGIRTCKKDESKGDKSISRSRSIKEIYGVDISVSHWELFFESCLNFQIICVDYNNVTGKPSGPSCTHSYLKLRKRNRTTQTLYISYF